jgi:predicted glycosyltransferase
MPEALRARLRGIAARKPRLRVLDFVQEPLWLLARADRIVAMGGYNSVCEILTLRKPALIVPRVKPRREQAIRAERLRALGFVDVLGADAVTPARIGEWLAGDAPQVRPHAVDLDGLARVPRRLARLLAPAGAAVTSPDSTALGARYVL